MIRSVELKDSGVYLHGGAVTDAPCPDISSREKTIAYRILRNHEKKPFDGKLHIAFDALISHDITYVGIIQTARASGLEKFPIPYALTNCHNSLCAVGGTINQDDHVFGLSAAKKYGGIYVPANIAVIHQFAREKLAGCGKMILGSDSHTRYGCYGSLSVGEGGGELVKQLLCNTWDIDLPEVVLVYVKGRPPKGTGPHDAALALVGATFPDGWAKNTVLEFAGPGIENLSMDFRTGIDVMTTETACLSSIWQTDETVKKYYENIGRPDDYSPLAPEDGAYYDKMVVLDLDKLESMIALPFHPSNVYTVHELQENAMEILSATEKKCNESMEGKARLDLVSCIDADGNIRCDQGIISGCAGGMYENIAEAAAILSGGNIGNGYFDMSVYPSSAPINLALMKDGISAELSASGAVIKPCFCGPCFGAGDTPSNGALSIRHTTRNFANREGSKPGQGQAAAVALMDARSIAATAANGGILTAATDTDYEVPGFDYSYSDGIYSKRCLFAFGSADKDAELKFGPNIKDWPKMPKMSDDLLLELCAVINDDVTTTDELIPSGETSSYRSNPEALSEFALSRRVPEYVPLSKAVREKNALLHSGTPDEKTQAALRLLGEDADSISLGSCIYANKPGDGSAREQSASCQKVLGGWANICREYATKRYRSNCINWGIVPFTSDNSLPELHAGDMIFVKDIKQGILAGKEEFDATLLRGEKLLSIKLYLKGLSDEEKQILTEGCLMNYYAANMGK